MTHHPLLTSMLLGCAVAIVLLCSLGILVMRDAYQRLQFVTPVASLAAVFITIAVFIEDSDPASRIKTIIILLVMFFMNGILSHATARAVRIKRVKRWQVDPSENIAFHNTRAPAGSPQPKEPA